MNKKEKNTNISKNYSGKKRKKKREEWIVISFPFCKVQKDKNAYRFSSWIVSKQGCNLTTIHPQVESTYSPSTIRKHFNKISNIDYAFKAFWNHKENRIFSMKKKAKPRLRLWGKPKQESKGNIMINLSRIDKSYVSKFKFSSSTLSMESAKWFTLLDSRSLSENSNSSADLDFPKEQQAWQRKYHFFWIPYSVGITYDKKRKKSHFIFFQNGEKTTAIEKKRERIWWKSFCKKRGKNDKEFPMHGDSYQGTTTKSVHKPRWNTKLRNNTERNLRLTIRISTQALAEGKKLRRVQKRKELTTTT